MTHVYCTSSQCKEHSHNVSNHTTLNKQSYARQEMLLNQRGIIKNCIRRVMILMHGTTTIETWIPSLKSFKVIQISKLCIG